MIQKTYLPELVGNIGSAAWTCTSGQGTRVGLKYVETMLQFAVLLGWNPLLIRHALWAGIGPQDLDTYLIPHHELKTFMHMVVGFSEALAKRQYKCPLLGPETNM